MDKPCCPQRCSAVTEQKEHDTQHSVRRTNEGRAGKCIVTMSAAQKYISSNIKYVVAPCAVTLRWLIWVWGCLIGTLWKRCSRDFHADNYRGTHNAPSRSQQIQWEDVWHFIPTSSLSSREVRCWRIGWQRESTAPACLIIFKYLGTL